MHHQLATSMVEQGHRVLFIENTGVRTPQFKDVGRIVERIKNWFSSLVGFMEIRRNLFLYSPVFLPFPYNRAAVWLNSLMIYSPLQQWMRAARCAEPIVVSFLPTPLAQNLIARINPVLSIYYCVDNMDRSSKSVARLRLWEDALFAKADIVFATSEAIAEKARTYSRSVYSFPAGVNAGIFDPKPLSGQPPPEDMAGVSRPVIGYVGAISEVFDRQIVVDLARALPEATLLLVGPKYSDMSFLDGIANIVWLDQRPHEQIPSYIYHFDVGLIPYVINPITDSVYSCKLNEYLAMGVPVVATNLREVRAFRERYPNSVEIGTDVNDFVAKVKQTLDDPGARSPESVALRMSVARDNTWERRFEGIMEVVNRYLSMKENHTGAWQEQLGAYYRRFSATWVRFAVFVVVFFLLLVHTPLVWFAGEPLVVRDRPGKADAIVVFSGVGDASYRNDRYQLRALEAASLYARGYAREIFISSGVRQNISDVEIIRHYLMDRGVPLSSIHILGTYPVNTYENVRMVLRDLRLNGVHSILFLTSPYHARRAALLWHRQAPDIHVIVPQNIDTPPGEPQWSANVEQMRMIAYEYAAIVYYWYKGWL